MDKSSHSKKIFLTISDVAERLGRCEKTVRRMIDTGEILARRFRNRWVMTEADLQSFVDSLKQNRRAAR